MKVRNIIIFAVSALAGYAIRSYAYQKEVKGYINGVKAVIEAEEKEEDKND